MLARKILEQDGTAAGKVENLEEHEKEEEEERQKE